MRRHLVAAGTFTLLLATATGVALAVSVCALTIGSSSAAADIIYTFDLPATGDLTLTGTITTDGKLGPLTLPDFLDWDATVYSASLSAGFEFLGPAHGPTSNSTLAINFGNVFATDTSLFLPLAVFDLKSIGACGSGISVSCGEALSTGAIKIISHSPLPEGGQRASY